MKKEHIDIYYDHYKDTFEKVLAEKERRHKYFIGMLSFLFLFIVILYIPTIVELLANDIVKNKLSTTISIDLKWIQTFFLFSFIWISFLYYQATLNIERLYCYLHQIEEKLSKRMGSLQIFREGQNYIEKYPIVLSFIHRVYNIAIPVSIILVFSILWINGNFMPINTWTFNNYIDTVIEAIIIVSAVLFLIRMNKDIFKREDS